MIKDNTGIERYSVGTTLFNFLNRITKKLVDEDQEFWIAYVGDTGTGKSLRAQKDAFVIDKTLNVKRLCFDRDEFIRAVIKAQKGEVVIADEAVSIFFNRASMTKEGRIVSEISNQIRQKNLCIMLCIPQLLSLDSTILEKINAICMVSESRKNNVLTKGNASYFIKYNRRPQTKQLITYFRVKRSNPVIRVRKPKPRFREKGNTVTQKPWYPIDESQYKHKKESVLDKYIKGPEEAKDTLSRDKRLRDEAIYHMNKKLGLSRREIAKTLKISHSTVNEAVLRVDGSLGATVNKGPPDHDV